MLPSDHELPSYLRGRVGDIRYIGQQELIQDLGVGMMMYTYTACT